MKGFHRTVIAGVMLVVVAAGASARAVEPADLVGTYSSKVTEPSGEKYEGTCEITHKTRRTVELTWTYGKKKSVGLGKLAGDTLTIEYQGAIADREGKGVYEVKSKDRIAGTWHRKGTKGTGKEVLVRKKNKT